MNTYALKVVQIKQETNDTITLCFKQPGLRRITYKAGQYLTLFFRINGRKYARPYSLSSSPSADALLEVTVKRVAGGLVSNYINDNIKLNDTIEVMQPMGDFIFEPTATTKEVYLWGVGSGITPLFSLAKELLCTQQNIKVHLIYGNKSPETAIFHSALNQLKDNHPNTFTLSNFYSALDPTMQTNCHKGRISKEFIHSLFNEHQSLNTCTHYICGPETLKNTIKEGLTEIGCPLNTIFTEDFELVKDPKDFEDIETRKVTINYNGEPSIITVVKGKSILDMALDAGIEIPYSCQTGNCDTCKGNLKNGKVKMIGLTKQRDDLPNDEFLLCCSYPLTDDVYLNVNR
jgi:ring-1,2-phenylacetyl-CoA epoxidase subunit PaaE